MQLIVLIACEESQAECQAFRDLGHEAYSCDIQPCRRGGHPEWHIKGSCIPYLRGRRTFVTQDGVRHKVGRWDMIIAHPPCTYLCKVSSLHLYKPPLSPVRIGGVVHMLNKERVTRMVAGRAFFMQCLTANAKFVAVENPIPMAMAGLPPPDAYACPSWFGAKWSKKTCYWLKGLPPLMAGAQHPRPKCFTSSSRGKYRSRTMPQLAEAIASQWSDYVMREKERKGGH